MAAPFNYTTHNCSCRHPCNNTNKIPSLSCAFNHRIQFRQSNNFQEKEEIVFANKKKHIAQLTQRIEYLASWQLENRNEYLNTETIDILLDQILELQSHLKVYEEIKARAYRLYPSNEDELSKQIRREIYRLESCLPVYSQRIKIEKHFNDTSRIVIIQGQTGSGKSTQVPQYVADHPRFIRKRIICTQPRKIAAVSLANRVAFEYNGGTVSNKQDGEIGYHVGGDRRVKKNCRIEFVTEGVLLERIVNGTGDIFNNVGCIIIDEAHERSVTCDILLGYFKKEDPRWKHILIVVTSATIDKRLFSNFFNGAPYFEIEGRTFPVDLKYTPLKETAESDIRNAVALCALQVHLTQEKQPGDILCFLPGQEDVLYAQSIFEAKLSKCGVSTNLLKAQSLVLYGRMEPEQQAKVFEKLSKNERKVIFSTDISETSVTIDGVVFVVDSGVKKEIIFDPLRNISSLKVRTISKSSAIQRAGRCGRTQAGICYRMYSEEEFEKMDINSVPEIHRKPISLAVLTLRGMQIDPSQFDWISAPSKDAILAADEELRYLGALDLENKLTELGKLISSVQQEPKIVKMIYVGCKNGFGDAAVNIASIISVSNIVFWNGNDEETKSKARKLRNEFSQPEGDVVTLYRIFEKWMDILMKKDVVQPEGEISKNTFNDRKKDASKWCGDSFINAKAMNLAFSTRRDLLGQFMSTVVWKKINSQEEVATNEDICRLACSGYFLNTARQILSKKANAAGEYCALHSEVIGKLDNKCSFLNSPNKTELPQWIIYDKIFRPSVTIFPVTSFIDISWIEAECSEFYQLCMKKQMYLPTERLTKCISQECLRMIVGKRFEKIESLEEDWNCGISADVETGRLELYCSTLNRSAIECLIDNKIADAILDLGKQVSEVDYLDGTRVVVGQGFEIKDVLFPQEYATIAIKDIPYYITSSILVNLLTQENEELAALDILERGPAQDAIAKFCFKNDAKRSFDRISRIEISNQKIKLHPKFGPRRQISQVLSTRLKLSWAIELSSGRANIDFHTAEEANNCIESLPNIFPGAKITRVHGDSEKSKQKINLNENGQSKNVFPTVLCIHIPYGSTVCRFRFNTDDINLSPLRNSFIYKITVVNLPLNLDEQDIKEILKQFRPKYVKVMRGKSQHSVEAYKLNPEEREAKLRPLQKWKTKISTRDFLEVNVRRAGTYIFFNSNKGNSDAKEAYNKADFSSLGLQCGQRHRLEIDYIHSVSINMQLMIFLEFEFTEFKLLANEKGINVFEVKPKNNSRFTVLKFRTNRQSNILWTQEQLEKITSCIKFTDEKIEFLFTRAGRVQMAVVAETGFVHWNYKNHGIWIYGNSELKEEISGAIKNIITSLSSMEVIDKLVELNEKIFNANKSPYIKELCEKFGISFQHIFGNKLYLSGSKDSVKNLESYLREIGLTRPICNQNKQNEETRECGVCFCVPDETFIVTILCGHLFCIGCITPLFEIKPAPPLPITCPTCNIPFALNDIIKCAPIKSLRSILEVSVYDYQKEHSTNLRICPRPDCSQILSYDSRTTGNNGGDFLFCNECSTTYCATCSEKLSKPIKSHEGTSCEDVQTGISSVVTQYVREIQENILNLSCPNCNLAFFEFTGCAAVFCDKCKCGFCGLCLRNCGTDAHAHVVKCSKNPGGNFFVTESALNEIHRSMRKQKIQDFVAKIEKPSIRNKVCIAIRKDLIDLGIEQRFIASLLVDDTSPNDEGDME